MSLIPLVQISRATSIWTKLVESLLKEKANGELAFYANMRYVDLARLQSNIGWAYLINDDIDNARVAYTNAFETLYSGEVGHKQVLVSSNQARDRLLQATLMATAYSSAFSKNATVRFFSQVLHGYMKTQGSTPDFMAEKRAPKLFEGLDKRTSDGIRVNVLPSLSPPDEYRAAP